MICEICFFSRIYIDMFTLWESKGSPAREKIRPGVSFELLR